MVYGSKRLYVQLPCPEEAPAERANVVVALQLRCGPPYYSTRKAAIDAEPHEVFVEARDLPTLRKQLELALAETRAELAEVIDAERAVERRFPCDPDADAGEAEIQ
jgi:hypothetical protein